jgi:signal peptidase II
MTGRKLLVLLPVLIACLGCDFVSKRAAEALLAGAPPLRLACGMVRLELTQNPGSFLGLGSALPAAVRRVALVWLLPVGLVLVCARRLRSPASSRVEVAALGLLAGGGLGNWCDRLLNRGLVTDFASVGLGPLRTGIFNLADVAIVTACDPRHEGAGDCGGFRPGRGGGGERRRRLPHRAGPRRPDVGRPPQRSPPPAWAGAAWRVGRRRRLGERSVRRPGRRLEGRHDALDTTSARDAAGDLTPAERRARRRAWAQLLRRVYEISPLTCARCGTEMRIISVILDPAVVKRILDHIRKKKDAGPRPPPDAQRSLAAAS